MTPTTDAPVNDSARMGVDRRRAADAVAASRLESVAVQDALGAALLTALSLVGVVTDVHVDLPEGEGEVAARALDTLGVGLILLQTVPLAWRRRHPVAVLAVSLSALFAFSILGYFASFAAFGFLIALFTVAAHRHRHVSIPAGIASGVALWLILVFRREPIEIDAILAEYMIVSAAWFLGDSLRIRREQVVQLEDRALRLERDREEKARQAVANERRVIARELHDVVAHNVSVMVAQAGAARRIASAEPTAALATLGNIEDVGREALVEMRRLMGLLRTESDRVVERSPEPGMHNLEALTAQVTEAGVPVDLRIEGTARPLPAGLDLSAFRIVQEALTNILKHAGEARANVLVRYGDGRLDLQIDDDGAGPEGRPARPDRLRYGHLGMRERVALFGGELFVGGRPGGGYRVAASLPTEPEPM
jgi:signal transduction histidine kinase